MQEKDQDIIALESHTDNQLMIDKPSVIKINDEKLARLMRLEKEADKKYKERSLGNCQNFCGHF